MQAPEEAPASSSKGNDRSVSREQRRKRRDGLRSKSVGVVVGKIDTSKTASNKILFGDNYAAEDAASLSAKNDAQEEDDDDDDQVEESKRLLSRSKHSNSVNRNARQLQSFTSWSRRRSASANLLLQ